MAFIKLVKDDYSIKLVIMVKVVAKFIITEATNSNSREFHYFAIQSIIFKGLTTIIILLH
jgi:hypothetical protein